MNDCTIKCAKANLSNFDFISESLKSAAIYLNRSGIDYWKKWLDFSPNTKSALEADVENGHYYIIQNNDENAGIYKLTYEDASWNEFPNKNAAYLHSFTIAKQFAGKKIGYSALDAIRRNLTTDKIQYLRLDCGTHNFKLRTYYEIYGFEFVGYQQTNGFDIALYEYNILLGAQKQMQ